MEGVWKYLSSSGDRVGPLDEATLAQRYQDRQINSETFVCHEDINKWYKIEELPDLEERLSTFKGSPVPESSAPPRHDHQPATPQIAQSAASNAEQASIKAGVYEIGLSVYKFVKLIFVKGKHFIFLKRDAKVRYGFIAIILGLFAYTNPSIEDYATTIRQGFVKEAASSDAEVYNMIFGGLADSFIANVTVRKNFIFFSTYHTEFGPLEASCLGALTTFMWCSEKTKEEDNTGS